MAKTKMTDDEIIRKQRQDAKNPNSHGVGILVLPSGEKVRVAYLPEALAYWNQRG